MRQAGSSIVPQSPVAGFSLALLAEGLLLALATPLLLFPTVSLPLTFLILVLLAVSWLAPLLAQRRPGIPATPFNLLLLLFCLSLIVSMLVTADPELSLPKATGIILGLAFWRYIVIVVRQRSQLPFALLVFLLAALGFTLIGILGLQAMLKIELLANLAPVQRIILPGSTSDAVHPNLLAGAICLFLPLLLSLLLAGRPSRYRRPIRLALLSFALLTLVILLLTQSRSGWLGLLAGIMTLLVAWALLLPPSRTRYALRWLLLLLGLVAVVAIIWSGPQRIQQLWLDPPRETVIGTLSTLNYRRALWPWAITAVADFPLTGTGLGAFREVVFRLYPVGLSTTQDVGHAHNILLQVALDFGLPGLISYLAMVLLAGGLAWRVAREDVGLRPIALGILASLMAFHFYGLADTVAMGAKPSLLFWLLLALATVTYRVSRSAP